MMNSLKGRVYVNAAYRDSIPHTTIMKKCFNWGIHRQRAGHLADQATAEAYLRSLDVTFENESHFRAWVTRTAINETISILRCERDGIAAALSFRACNDHLESHEAYQALHDEIDRLPEQDRQILEMSFQKGLTLDEIASHLYPDPSASANALRLRIKRKRDATLRHLRDALAAKGYDLDSFKF